MTLTQAPKERKESAAGRDDSPAPLGSTYQYRFPNVVEDDRILRFAMQAAARELHPEHRIRHCLRAVIPGKTEVEIWQAGESGKAYYQNLVCCGAVWVCPVCASKISERRRRRLDQALNVTDKIPILENEGHVRFIVAPRYYLSMITLTISHKANERASEVIKRLKAAYKKAWSGRFASDFKKRYGIIGMIRAIEITHGVHGWHPHYHILIIRNSANTHLTMLNLDVDITERWRESCEFVGAFSDDLHGVTVKAGDNRAGEYLDKIGQQVGETIKRWTLPAEMTKYVVKTGREKHRTLWDLLADYMGGDVKAGRLWIQGVSAMKGTNHLTASPGLWKRLGVPDLDAKDESLAETEQSASDRLLARLRLSQWRTVLRVGARGRLLELAEEGGDIDAYIKGLERIRESVDDCR